MHVKLLKDLVDGLTTSCEAELTDNEIFDRLSNLIEKIYQIEDFQYFLVHFIP
jgi:hypothetical protein